MRYSKQFENDFMNRTLTLLEKYNGELDATLLLNCLLGLVVLPKERLIDKIPADPISELEKWGISNSAITSGTCSKCDGDYPKTIRQFVKGLRNAVAHLQVEPFEFNDECGGFEFSDRTGFRAHLTLDAIRRFVMHMASHLRQSQNRKCA